MARYMKLAAAVAVLGLFTAVETGCRSREARAAGTGAAIGAGAGAAGGALTGGSVGTGAAVGAGLGAGGGYLYERGRQRGER